MVLVLRPDALANWPAFERKPFGQSIIQRRASSIRIRRINNETSLLEGHLNRLNSHY